MAVVLGVGRMAATPGAGPRYVEGLDEAVSALGLRGLRPAARAARLAAVVAAEALQGANRGDVPHEGQGVVLGTRFASIEPLVEFARAAALDGPGLVNPASFPNVVVNAHAGYLAILFGLAGPNVTLCGPEAGIEAIGAALDLLDRGRADLVLAGGVESLGPTIAEGLQRGGIESPAEAAAFLLLARDGDGIELSRVSSSATASRTWSAADMLLACGAAASALGAVLAVEAAQSGRGPQLVTSKRVTLLVGGPSAGSIT